MPVFPASDGTPRGRLLAAGFELFAEKGYPSTSVREIVKRAGVTKPVLYYYFKNKEGLFRAVLDWMGEHQKRNLKEVLEVQGTTLERLEALFRTFVQIIKQHRKHFTMMTSLMFSPVRGVPEYDFHQFPKRVHETVTTIYREGIERGEVQDIDPGEASLAVIALMFFSIKFLLHHEELYDEELPVKLLHHVFRGLALKEELP